MEVDVESTGIYKEFNKSLTPVKSGVGRTIGAEDTWDAGVVVDCPFKPKLAWIFAKFAAASNPPMFAAAPAIFVAAAESALA